MSLIQMTIFSDILRRDLHVNVIYPQNCERTPLEAKEFIQPPYPVLYLLHGLSGNEDSWLRFTALERYVRDQGLVVVMPTTDRMFYVNNEKGYRYGDFLTQELPEIIANTFNISTAREDTFIAGASMGGYGAFNAALKYPENYGYVGSFSGVMDLHARYLQGPDPQSPEEFDIIFGGKDPQGTDKDLYYLMEELKLAGAELPKCWMACGKDDYLIEQHRKFYEQFAGDLSITYREEDGDHSWIFWDEYLPDLLEWLPTKK